MHSQARYNSNVRVATNLQTSNPTLDAQVNNVAAAIVALANSRAEVKPEHIDALGIIGPHSTILALAGPDTPTNQLYLGNSSTTPLQTVTQYLASQLSFLSLSGMVTTSSISLGSSNPSEAATLVLILKITDKNGVHFATISYVLDLVVGNGGNAITLRRGQRIRS